MREIWFKIMMFSVTFSDASLKNMCLGFDPKLC